MGDAARSKRRHIPSEIVEEILLNLPVKSILRFSTVSKSWSSIIFDAGFIRRHKCRAALPGRERILISHSPYGYLNSASIHSLSSTSPNQAADDAAAPPLICPFKIEGSPKSYGINLAASCGELWCVEHGGELFLWNPSMRTYKKLPHPSDGLYPPNAITYQLCFAMGYDSIGDDYKILKVNKSRYHELYSLRSDSWKIIEPFPVTCYSYRKGVYVGGVVHWMVYQNGSENEGLIISFDLSTEKYGEVARPPYYIYPAPRMDDKVKLTVFRGKLCLHLNYYDSFVLWVMEEYGVGKSWTKLVGMWARWSYEESPPMPLYFYDDGKILIKVSTVFMYIDKESTRRIVLHSPYDEDTSGHLYVESLVSPATYCGPRCRPPTGGRQRRNHKSYWCIVDAVRVICSIFCFNLVLNN